VPPEEDIRLEAVLHPREEEEGGPCVRLACRSCGAEAVLEEVPGGAPILAPPVAAGLEVPLFATLLDGPRAREARRQARAWMDRWGPALEGLRARRSRSPRAESPPPPRPPPPRGWRPGATTPPPAPDPAPPPPTPRAGARDLPRTAEEARALLGVTAGASLRDIESAYRKAARRCHPDLVSHLDDDFQRLAHEKFLRLQRAHDILTR
jgi:DnaJ-domain-containing protein 1